MDDALPSFQDMASKLRQANGTMESILALTKEREARGKTDAERDALDPQIEALWEQYRREMKPVRAIGDEIRSRLPGTF